MLKHTSGQDVDLIQKYILNQSVVFVKHHIFKLHYITSCEIEVTFENASQELTTADQIGAKTIQSHD